MTNLELAQELYNKSVSDLQEIGNLTADLIIANRTETEQNEIAQGLDLIGISVVSICERKKTPNTPNT